MKMLCSLGDYSLTHKPCNKNYLLSKLFTKCIHSTVYSPVLILLLDACYISDKQEEAI